MSIRAVEISEAVQSLAEYAQQISAGPVVVTKGGQPVAVVVSVENADMESISLSLNPEFLERGIRFTQVVLGHDLAPFVGQQQLRSRKLGLLARLAGRDDRTVSLACWTRVD